MFYTFNQNNSGGSFDLNKKTGLTHFTIVEGTDIDDIVDRAERLGIYFDGVDDGSDCDCCGDRWYRPYDESCLTNEPMIYQDSPKKYIEDANSKNKTSFATLWMEKGYEICINYMDGRKEWL